MKFHMNRYELLICTFVSNKAMPQIKFPWPSVYSHIYPIIWYEIKKSVIGDKRTRIPETQNNSLVITNPKHQSRQNTHLARN